MLITWKFHKIMWTSVCVNVDVGGGDVIAINTGSDKVTRSNNWNSIANYWNCYIRLFQLRVPFMSLFLPDSNALIDLNCALNWIIWCWICKLPILKCRCTYKTVFVFVLNLIVIARFPCFLFYSQNKDAQGRYIYYSQPQWILLKWIRWCFRKKKKIV